MGFFQISTIILLVLGVLSHIAAKVIGEEEYKTEGFVDAFKTYAKSNPIQMIFSAVFTFVFIAAYIDSGGLFLTIDFPVLGVNANTLLSAFFTGYLLDSISRNVRKLFETKVKAIK